MKKTIEISSQDISELRKRDNAANSLLLAGLGLLTVPFLITELISSLSFITIATLPLGVIIAAVGIFQKFSVSGMLWQIIVESEGKEGAPKIIRTDIIEGDPMPTREPESHNLT